MAGQSKQEKQGEELYGDISNIKNRFDNYENPFGFGDVSSNLDKVYGGYEDIINRDTAEASAKGRGGAASSLASRGITGGSVLTDTQSKITSDVNKSKTNALSQLGIGKASSLSDLMKYFNALKFKTTEAATGAEFGKFGLQQGALGFLDDDTWLDDLFAGFNAAGNVAGGVAGLFSGGGPGPASGGG